MTIPPMEDRVGPSGSACEYGGINLQIDPFASPDAFEKLRDKTWVPVPDLGDTAYFRDNRGEFGELYVRAGAHMGILGGSLVYIHPLCRARRSSSTRSAKRFAELTVARSARYSDSAGPIRTQPV